MKTHCVWRLREFGVGRLPRLTEKERDRIGRRIVKLRDKSCLIWKDIEKMIGFCDSYCATLYHRTKKRIKR